MEKYSLFFAATFIYVASSAQVLVDSYNSSHVPANGIFGSEIKINETVIPAIDLTKINKITSGLHKSGEP